MSESGQIDGTALRDHGQPSVTVIVCTRDRPLQLEHCLSALARQSYPRFDILVVDNASVLPVRELCQRYGVGYVHEPVAGLSRARNVGARRARGDLIAYIDDDAIAEPGWLDSLAGEFSDPKVAAVCGKYRYMKTYDDPTAMSDDEATDGIIVRPRGRIHNETPGWFALACFGGIGEGSNMAFRGDLIPHSFAFDERLGRGRLLDSGEEGPMFMSLIARGHHIVRAPEAVIRHPYPAAPSLQLALRSRQLRSAVAQMLFLWFEFPEYRSEILRYLRRAIARRLSRPVAIQPAPIRLPRWQTLWAILGGPLMYWKARQEWTAMPRQFR